jgi:hypothetical protein
MQPDSTQVQNLLSDPLKLVQLIGGLFGIISGLYVTITKVYPWWRTWRDWRSFRKRQGAEIYTREDIVRATTCYIRPYCQHLDPAGGEESRLLAPVQEDLFRVVDRILASPNDYKFAILLADSGMGKTSFVLNYYADHWRHWRKRQRFDLAVVPLGIPKADEHIRKIANPNNTVLFLDAFDEDTRAIEDHRERLGQLLELSQEFRQILITCRTQFFLREEEIPRETGMMRVGVTSLGQSREYLFYKLYLSPFSDAQVEAYLKRRFSLWRFRQRQRAREIAQKISDLIARPMLLAHIETLVQSGKTEPIQYPFQLYEKLVEAWLERERPFVKNKEDLRRFSEQLAVDLYLNREARGAERVPHTDLVPLARRFKIPLEDWQLRGRSLLNRDAGGNYKFAHRSIMEYLFVKRFVEDSKAFQKTTWTDQMKRFLLEMLRSTWETNHKLTFDLSGADLSELGRLQTQPIFKLRSSEKRLKTEEARRMLKEIGFFDTNWNKEGQGLFHLYELREIKGSEVIIDHATGLMWQQSGSSRMKYADAEKYIRDLNAKRFAGYNDWRLPTLEEAMSLMEKHGNLYIDPLFDQTQMWIWTVDKESAGVAWVVYFNYGSCYHYDVDIYLYYVRAVRGGQSSI